MKSWFAIDGRLDPIDYEGDSFFRFPQELAEIVISSHTQPGERVLDPFCGFGTTLVVAERLGRIAVGGGSRRTSSVPISRRVGFATDRGSSARMPSALANSSSSRSI